ncbi:MAG TPA: SPW repeat protein [Pyrinomonadaceae bacterium]|nr:SPW repeat protein [Pyrinomonadaceae bacterium]
MATRMDEQAGGAGGTTAGGDGADFGSARSDYGGLAYGGRLDKQGLESGGGSGAGVVEALSSAVDAISGATESLPTPKVIKPTPHAVVDYAMAGTLMAAPWLFGFSDNKTATANSVISGAAVLGLSLMTRYPLGAAKLVPFPVHGVVETLAAVMNTAAPWLMGFSRNKRATSTHVAAGLATLAVVALTDYRAAEPGGGNGGA